MTDEIGVRVVNRLSRRLPTLGRDTRTTGAGYDAFISYSHAADGKLAPSLQRGLRAFAKPWYRLNALRVFRDQTSLSATPALWPSIERALSASRFFILLASPEAAASPWVDKEVSYWREQKEMGNFVIALTEGEIAWSERAGDVDWEQTTALPRSLERGFVSEPLWVDLRFARAQSDVSLRQPDFRNAIADLAAPIHGRDKDTLLGEDITQHRRTVRLALGGVVILVLLLMAASVSTLMAVQRTNTARTQLHKATSLALASAADDQLATHPDVSLLLSLEANELGDSAQARSSMVSALRVARGSGVEVILRSGPVASVVFGPHGHTLAAGGADGLRLWDARSHSPLGGLPGHAGSVTSLAISPNGRTLASAGADGTVRLWDALSREPLGKPLRSRVETVLSLAFSRDGRTLASGGFPGTQLWDVRDRRHPKRLGDPLPTQDTHTGSVETVVFSPDGRTLASVSWDMVLLWDVRARKQLTAPFSASGTRSFGSAAFSRDGRMLAVSCSDGLVRLWDLRRKASGQPLRGGKNSLGPVAFSPDRRTLAVGEADGVVRYWDVRSPKPRAHSFRGHTGSVSSLAFSPDGRTLASGSGDGTVRLWHMGRREPLGRPLHGHTNELGTVVFSPDRRMLASIDRYGGKVWLWDLRTRRLLGSLRGQTKAISSVAFSHDGRTLATDEFETGTVRLWDVSSRKPVGKSLHGLGWVESVVLYADSRILTVARKEDGTIWLWDVSERKALGQPLRGNTPHLWAVALSPDGHTLAVGGRNGAVQLWDVPGRKSLGKPLTGHKAPVHSLAFSPDGHTLASAAADFDSRDGIDLDGTVRLWDVRKHEPLGQPLHGHQDWVASVAFSPDGHTLVSAGGDETVRLWDVHGRKQLGAPLRYNAGHVYSVAVSPDGRTLATAGRDRTVRLWTGILWHDIPDLRKQVCKLVVGNLTPAEWDELVPDLTYRTTCTD